MQPSAVKLLFHILISLVLWISFSSFTVVGFVERISAVTLLLEEMEDTQIYTAVKEAVNIQINKVTTDIQKLIKDATDKLNDQFKQVKAKIASLKPPTQTMIDNQPIHSHASTTPSKWVKAIANHNSNQTSAHLYITFTNTEVSNRAITDGLYICHKKCQVEKSKHEPTRCLKCQGWNHLAKDCIDPLTHAVTAQVTIELTNAPHGQKTVSPAKLMTTLAGANNVQLLSRKHTNLTAEVSTIQQYTFQLLILGPGPPEATQASIQMALPTQQHDQNSQTPTPPA